jgi:hypothetical protein
MSTSKLLPKDLFKVASFKAVLARNQDAWRSSSTLEDRLVKEAKALDYFFDVEDNHIDYSPITQFESPDIQYLSSVYDMLANFSVSNRAKYSVLADLYLNKYNNNTLLLQDLLNQVRRIKQKHAVISLGNSNFRKYVVGDSFLSLTNLDYGFCGGTNAELDPIAGAAHLPVTLRQQQTPTNVLLGSESNGAAGSSDPEVDSTNQKLDNLLSSNNTQSFFYERLQQGPCKLALTFQFNRPTLINQFIINLNNIDDGVVPELAKVSFVTADNQNINFKDLTEQSIKSITRADNEIGALFPPIEVVSVSFLLTQSSAVSLLNAAGKTIKQFAIVVDSVEFWLNQYSATGLINSQPVELPAGLFAFEPVIEYYPSTQEFFDLILDVSFDGGVTWTKVADENKVDISLVESRNFLWRLRIDRIDSAFSSYSSFLATAFDSVKRKFIQKSVIPNVSPYSLSLTSKPKGEEDIYVWQPKLLPRNDISNGFKIGVASSVQTKVKLPFDTAFIEPTDLKISIGSNELVYVTPGNTPTGEEWTYTDDFKSIVLGSDVVSGAIIYASLEPEQIQLVDTSEGYLATPSYPFDTDKSCIKLKAFEPKLTRSTLVLPKFKTVIRLGNRNIKPSSFELISAAGDTWTEGIDRPDIDGETDQYYLDAPNGVLYLSNIVGEDSVSVSYQHYQDKILSDEDYDIYYSGAVPVGFLIQKKALPVQTVAERIGSSLISTLNPITGTHEQRPTYIASSSTSKQLGYKNIIKGSLHHKKDLLANNLLVEEVDYVDGKSEFLGLIKVDKELTNEQEADGSGLVSFYLGARSLWYRDFGVSFSSSYFTTMLSPGSSLSTGEYYIQKSGLVVVKVGVGNTLPGDIAYSYYYRSEEADPDNKISVDYTNGILYSYSDLNEDSQISYSVCPTLAYYDIVKPLAFEYDKTSNQLQFSTLGMDPTNSFVKVSWIEAPFDLSPSQIKENFTPVVSRVGFRFN